MVNKNDVLLLNEIKKKKYLSPSIRECGALTNKVIAGSVQGIGDDVEEGENEEIVNPKSGSSKAIFYNEYEF